jgi:hypothetical protein
MIFTLCQMLTRLAKFEPLMSRCDYKDRIAIVLKNYVFEKGGAVIKKSLQTTEHHHRDP